MGRGRYSKTMPGPLSHNLMDQFVKMSLVIKSFASLGQMVRLGSVNSQSSLLRGWLRWGPLCKAQISSYYASCPAQSLIVSQAPVGVSRYREPSTSSYCAPDLEGRHLLCVRPLLRLCAACSHCEGSIIRTHAWCWSRSPQFLEPAFSGHTGSTWGRQTRESRKATWRRAADSGALCHTWEKKAPESAGLKSLLPASFPSCPAGGKGGPWRGLLLPPHWALGPEGMTFPQTSVSSSAHEGQEWSQSQRPVRGSARAAAPPVAPRPTLGLTWGPVRMQIPGPPGPTGCHSEAGPLAAFKEPSRDF